MENKCNKMTTRGGHCISVIVPVYKVEPYLRCCIDSILSQTFTDFELILIDDGSPDNCGEICDEYAAKDDRVVVIHQENGGLSAARNAGIDWVFANSESQWITFVDSDDYIPAQYLEVLHHTAVRDDVDVVTVLGAYFVNNVEIKDVICDTYGECIMSGRDACKSLYLNEGKLAVTAWGKLFRTMLFCDYRFPAGKIHEDQDLTPKLLFCADSVAVLRAWMYGYRQTPSSITRSAFSHRRFDDIDAIDSCISFFAEHNDVELVELAKKKKDLLWVDYVIKAWQVGVYETLPAKYRMPLWKAWYITIRDTLRRGGLKFVFIRLGNWIRKFIKK